MTTYASGSITFDGLLDSGTDFTEMISKLKKIELRRAEQLGRWYNDWDTRYQAFGQLETELNELSSLLSGMNSVDKFLVKNGVSSNTSVASVSTTHEALEGAYSLEVNQLASNSYASLNTNVMSLKDSINTGATSQKIKLQYGTGADQKDYEFTIPPGTTLEGLRNIINQDKSNPDVRMNLILGKDGYTVQFYSMAQGPDSELQVVDSGSDLAIFDHSLAWQNQVGKSAQVRINGWPDGDWHEMDTNSIMLGNGLNVTLHSKGTTTVTVGVDKDQIRKNVEDFVDAFNKVRTTLSDMTKVDTNKGTTDPDYAESQFEMQQGGVLTGNYGVQMISSRLKSAVMDQGKGFDYLTWNDSMTDFTGDMFSSLSHIGIKTDAVEGSPTFGLLIFEPAGTGLPTFDECLDLYPDGVASLFSANMDPISESPGDFNLSYAMAGFTKPGKYDVKYEIDASGTPINATINGATAKWDAERNMLYLADEGGDARGISLNIFNLTPGHTVDSSIRLKQGKLTELCSVINDEMLEPDDGPQDTKKGTISILKSQYRQIMDNIQLKIAREDERIITWEKRTKLRFSRLQATLKTYEGMQATLESQIKQLSGNSSS